MNSRKKADSVGSRSVGARFGSGARVAALTGILMVVAAGRAGANDVSKNETIGCGNGSCVDSFEIKCPQASSFLCVTLTPDEDNDIQSFGMVAIATSPTAMVGQAFVRVTGGDSIGQCLQRPGREGTMKALVTVTGNGGPDSNRYELSAECYAGDFINGLESKKTTLSLKQDE